MPAATMLAASSRVTVVSFSNFSQQLKSFRYTPGNSDQVLRCASPFEATSFQSATPHVQRLFSIQKVSCVLRKRSGRTRTKLTHRW